jgi:DNA-binding response OmpR family regulator
MPARIVVVHDDTKFVEEVAGGLMAEGHEVATFPDPIAAWDAFEAAQKSELLVTRVNFPPGRSNGLALALMARTRRREIKVLFLAKPDYAEEIRDVGMYLLVTAAPQDVAAEVKRLLNAS